MTIKGSAYSCELNAAANVRFQLDLPVPEDTAVYAVKRFISHSPILRRVCTYRSYRLRIGIKGKRLRTLTFEVPARLLELPGSSVRATLQVNQQGVTITAVSLSDNTRCDTLRFIA